MAQFVPINRERHSDRYWRRFNDLFFVAQTSMVPLVARELPMAALTMPTAFALMGGRYTLVGLFSIVAGQNLFVGPDGKWAGDYMPAAFRSHPFGLLKNKESSEMVFCVDEASGLVGDQGEPFFDTEGNLTETVAGIFDFLKQVEQNRAGTEHAVTALADAGLISPWEIKAVVEGQEKKIEGIFRIDEDKLNKLNDETFIKLRKVYALPVAYGQLLSMGNLRVLQALVKIHEEKRKDKDPGIEGFSLRL